MSRYALFAEDENLEIFVGFDEGFAGFFLTVADVRTCTGELASYLFHNMEHYPVVGMTLEEVADALRRFGMALPSDLLRQLVQDARHCGVLGSASVEPRNTPTSALPPTPRQKSLTIIGWQSAL